MKTGKNIVDLIIIPQPKSAAELMADYRQKVAIWNSKLKALQDHYFENNYDSAADDVQEVAAMRRFLAQFLKQRLDWIEQKVDDEQLKRRYLQVIPPFYQKGGIRTLLHHFFQLTDSEDKKTVTFKAASKEEREIRVLWDLYKLKKTIESIVVLESHLNDGKPFDSIFSLATRKQRLSELKQVFKLMFQMCVQPEYQKELYQGISPNQITADAILTRADKGISYVYPHVLKKFDYRNHFFYIYFYSGMKAKIGGEEREFRFNYLDFEIIKQEFLIHWMNQKLQGNPKKMEIYAKYKYGQQTMAEFVTEHPDKEIEVLQHLPHDVFNDITAEVNEVVDPSEQVAGEIFSENYGNFAETLQKFDKAKKAAKLGLSKLRQMVGLAKAPEPVKTETPPEPEPTLQPEPAVEAPKETRFEVVKIKVKEIEYPYYVRSVADFQKRLNLLRAKLGAAGYTDLNKKISKFFNQTAESSFIQRRTPKHEWILPYVVKQYLGGDLICQHMVLVGAEVKAKGLGMGYSASAGQNAYQFTGFLVYATDRPEPKLGAQIDQRNYRGINFPEFSLTEDEVRERALKFFDIILAH